MDTLLFLLGKLVGAFLKAETWLFLLAVLLAWSVWTERRRLARRASGLLVAMLLLLGTVPLGDVMLGPIETHFAARSLDGEPLDGIIVLGGGEDVRASVASGQAQLGEGGDRYLAALALATQNPEARILFAGGSGRLRDVAGAEVSEASIAERIFLAQGISPGRLLFEARSRNTAENASRAFALARPDPDDRWVLVTSAFHMPRAMRSFEAAGWENLVAHPVDYRSWRWSDALGWNLQRNLAMLNTGLREWVGRAAYALLGR